MLSYLWKGKKDKVENENPELAMRDALDEHGYFKYNADGTLEYEEYLAFRIIVMRQACRDFNANNRKNLNDQKVEAFKARD